MYIKEFKKTTYLQGFTFKKGFKALISDSGRVLAATSGFYIHEGNGSEYDANDYKVRYYLQDNGGEWYPVNERLCDVWYTFANRLEDEALYKMLRQGPEEIISQLESLQVKDLCFIDGRFYRIVTDYRYTV